MGNNNVVTHDPSARCAGPSPSQSEGEGSLITTH
jgi:hypothetical protein